LKVRCAPSHVASLKSDGLKRDFLANLDSQAKYKVNLISGNLDTVVFSDNGFSGSPNANAIVCHERCSSFLLKAMAGCSKWRQASDANA